METNGSVHFFMILSLEWIAEDIFFWRCMKYVNSMDVLWMMEGLWKLVIGCIVELGGVTHFFAGFSCEFGCRRMRLCGFVRWVVIPIVFHCKCFDFLDCEQSFHDVFDMVLFQMIISDSSHGSEKVISC